MSSPYGDRAADVLRDHAVAAGWSFFVGFPGQCEAIEVPCVIAGELAADVGERVCQVKRGKVGDFSKSLQGDDELTREPDSVVKRRIEVVDQVFDSMMVDTRQSL